MIIRVLIFNGMVL